MAAFTPDTSCKIPALLPEHAHHARAVSAINRLLGRGDTMLIVAHTLLETYSSLTRMPLASRVSAGDALAGIEQTFLASGTVVTSSPEEYAGLIRHLASLGTIGGQVYDAAIVVCARAAGAEVILTFNEGHFRRFAGNGLSIEVP
jgi:predicted nucleic acid-binding protein